LSLPADEEQANQLFLVVTIRLEARRMAAAQPNPLQQWTSPIRHSPALNDGLRDLIESVR
jgi:hypothetical protein